jgi:hypothetical protein
LLRYFWREDFREWTPLLAEPLELEGVRSVGAVK